MWLKVLGCTGNMGGLSAPASGYLTELDNSRTFVIDLGPGVFAELQKIPDPVVCDLLLIHVYPDHTADTPGLFVWRRSHPTAPTSSRNLLIGPGDIHDRVDTTCRALGSEENANLEDTFDQIVSNLGEPLLTGGGEADGGAVVTSHNMAHPVPTVGYHIGVGGLTIAYTGDTARTDELAELTWDTDIFTCEATWCSNEEGTPPDVRLTGYGAGKAATLTGVEKLMLTHIPSYADGEEALRAAKSISAGGVELTYLGTELGG